MKKKYEESFSKYRGKALANVGKKGGFFKEIGFFCKQEIKFLKFYFR